jgi:NADH-quinone oxidoreductase subunit H
MSIFVSAMTMAAVMMGITLGFVTYAIYAERKVLGWMQLRIGPNRVGPWGLLQTVADVLKLLLKEDIVPHKADRTMFLLAPIVAFVPSFTVIAALPFSEHLLLADITIGLLYVLAVSSISTLGIVLGGWASNNKYALLGGMRAAAQMISYEVPLLLSVVPVVMLAGSLRLGDIVQEQAGGFWHWYIVPQFVAFGVFLIASVAELNRTPFDLPEAESELVAGYHVEYSGFRFAFFMLAEYMYVFAMAAMTTVLFLGGWHAPHPALDVVPGVVWFVLKFVGVVFFLFWIRATLPRLRVDQLMGFAWTVLLPIALFDIVVTAIVQSIIR